MSLFVLEIGSEELPARFLPTEEKELHSRFVTALEEHAIGFGAVRIMTTPRRAVVFIEDIEPIQKQKEELITGPPVRVAYDADGKATKALEGFLRTNAVSLEDIFTQDTDKGAYIAVNKRVGGASVATLLQEICPAIITAQPFPKKMRWGAHTLPYARPLRWILALFDDAIVPFNVGHIKADRITWGHRVHTKAEKDIFLCVKDAQSYLDTVRTQGCVEPESTVRRQTIIEGGNTQAKALGGTVLWKESLLDEVQGLCEHPVPLMGNIDPSFLEVPREVLLTSMESHQKSFGIEDANGKLMPHFLTVLNMTPPDSELVQKGWERVLRARLEDARFFWRSDMAESLETWLERLDSVIFLGPLGTMGDKTRRLEKLCVFLTEQCGASLTPQDAARAGRLSKADLVTGMVGEFDTLQGIMGSIYAQKKGESPLVAQALAEQYLPAGPDSAVPSTLLGALVSMADKVDTLVGCFGLGMIPTGTADPNALRRCALGIARCILAFELRLDMRALFQQALELYGDRPWKLDAEACLEKLQEFFDSRLKNLWQGQGHDTLLVDATLGAAHTSRDVWTSYARLGALENLRQSERYTEAVQTFKRVANIVRKQGQEGTLTGVYTAKLLQEEAEKNLAHALDTALPRFDTLWHAENFQAIPALLLELRPALHTFFDNVMVICDDTKVRENRLNMLKALMDRMEKFADFAALQV